MKEERRKCLRYPLLLKVQRAGESETVSEWTENVSAEGLFVRTDHSFKTGEGLSLEVSFPGLWDPIPIEARVAWVRAPSPITPGGLGLRIVSTESALHLEALVSGCERRENPAASPFRVLMVDDNTRVARSYQRVLGQSKGFDESGIALSFAADGYAALKILRAEPVDLLLTDIYMPVMNGIDLIRAIRSKPEHRELAIIVITGGRADERERAIEAGANAFMEKPIQFGKLVDTMICLLAARHG